MTSSIFSAALLLSLAVPAWAQQAQPKHMKNPHKAAVKMGQKLGLSQDQTAKLEPILAERQQKLAALNSNTALTEAQRKQQRHGIQQGTQSELSGVLSPDQMQHLKGMRRNGKASPTAKPPAGI